ncbi:MAG: ModD protein [Candidatus Thiodiazotropha sp.]|jgi:molybdenum transport protein
MSNSHCTLSHAEIENLLREDAPYGDLTVAALGIGPRPGRILFYSRDPMQVCGTEEAVRLFELVGARAELHTASGLAVEPEQLLLSAEGSTDSLFRAWKVAQSLIESVSGVSTLARRIVQLAGAARVACTRKHMPGQKVMMVKAVESGGACMHRLGLSESIMVTAEHRAFLLDDESAGYLGTLQGAYPEKKIIVEVDTLESALALVRQGCQVIQLEKLSPEQVAQVAAAVHSDAPVGQRPVIAAAGGIGPDNAAEYAAAGADVLVTSAPYFAKPRDVQVRFESN